MPAADGWLPASGAILLRVRWNYARNFEANELVARMTRRIIFVDEHFQVLLLF